MQSFPPILWFILTLMMTLAGGGPNDLLGYLSSSAYWHAKNVTPTVEQLTQELVPTGSIDVSKLIADLSADDPGVREQTGEKIVAVGPGALQQLDRAVQEGDAETAARSKALAAQIRATLNKLSVRRLMAIRSLGEMKKPESVPALRAMLASKEPFVAQYAAAAIAAIEGKPAVWQSQPIARRMTDVNLLSAKVDMVCQLAPTGGPVLPIDRLVGRFPLPMTEADKSTFLDQMNANLISAVEMLGNVRIDLVTMGWYTAPEGKPGHAVILVRGQFDSAAATLALTKGQVPAKVVDDVNAYMMDDSTAMLFPSDNLMVTVAAETLGEMPIEATLASLQKGVGTFRENADLNGLIKTIDVNQPLWMVTRLDDLKGIYSFLDPFTRATLVARPTVNGPHPAATVELAVTGTDMDAVNAAVADAQMQLQAKLVFVKAMSGAQPALKPLVEAAQSLKISPNGTKVAATADVSLGALLPTVVEQLGMDGN